MDVYVIENPRVLEAALASQATATLVCTQGNPTTTALDLFTGLAAAGCVNCQPKSPEVAIETPHLRRAAEGGQVLVITPLRVSSSRRRWVRIR